MPRKASVRARIKAGGGGSSSEALPDIVAEAARLICEEHLLDYRAAKLKAAERLGLSTRAALPDNARLQAAVIEYQRIFGGVAYAEHLRALRSAAVSAMKLLAEFSPRLVGAVVSGAINDAHRVQIHGFADQPEQIDFFLEDRGIPFQQDERDYRYADGREEAVPLARFEAGAIGIDVAMFALDGLRRAPLSPYDGLPMQRRTLADAEALARIDVATILSETD